MRTLLILICLPLVTFAQGKSKDKPAAPPPTVVIAEAEKFKILDEKGWKVTHQNDSYASHTYGGMWVSHGGGLGAPAASVGSIASYTCKIPVAGEYRIWSKYQAPAYFNYLHKIEIIQEGKTVFSHVYGKKGTDRLWSFSGESDELWWPWGIDHDCAEAPKTMVKLAAGPAEIRLSTVENVKPAGDRFIDFVVLTTEPNDTYTGFKPYQVGSPFCLEAIAANEFYIRFKNTHDKPAQLTVTRWGHFQPQYQSATTKIPEKPVEAGQMSGWINIGPFCRLVHDEGLLLSLAPNTKFVVQFSLDAEGKKIVGETEIASGETVVVPIDICWNPKSKVRASKEYAQELIAESAKWTKANGGKKPEKTLFYGAFSGTEDWVMELKHSLGYNTLLPDKYPHVTRDGLFAHASGPEAIKNLAKSLKNKENFRVLSFGDEIPLGQINFNDEKNNEGFRKWLQEKNVTREMLGQDISTAKLTAKGDSRLVWYSTLYNEERRFADFRQLTELARAEINKDVLTGANYSPHHLALYYGPVAQWVDIFKHKGMSLFWAEDYIFSVPEVPQIISFQFAQIRCAVKYHNTPIHFYVMPHSPGQLPEYFRRNTLLACGNGANHIDNFWVAPAERFTENYVAWGYKDMFKAIHDCIFETAEAEKILSGGKVRPAKVALVLSKATDIHESNKMVAKNLDYFGKQCKNAPKELNQIVCRKEQQMLYLALKNAQYDVDLITEDDIVELNSLKNYEVVYFAGEWMDNRIVPKLEEWVKAGGIFYTCAGCGLKNQFNEYDAKIISFLGLNPKGNNQMDFQVAVVRTLLELPMLPEFGKFDFNGKELPAFLLKQNLDILAGTDTEVLAKWKGDPKQGGGAVTRRKLGQGQIICVGTTPGNNWMKSGLRITPWARGGQKMVYNPTDFDATATELVLLGVNAKKLPKAASCGVNGVESIVMDNTNGTVLTLVNWTNQPVETTVNLSLDFNPKEIRCVSTQKAIPFKQEGNIVTFSVRLKDADYYTILK